MYSEPTVRGAYSAVFFLHLYDFYRIFNDSYDEASWKSPISKQKSPIDDFYKFIDDIYIIEVPGLI